MFLIFFLMLVGAYLLGCVNFAIILSKCMGLQDPRTKGSGNPGATNILRGGSKIVAVLVLVGDVLKGVISVLLAAHLGISGSWLALIGLAAILGHMFPIFFKFKGGKGVATTLGVIFSLSLGLGIVLLLVFFVIVALTRYISLGSICAIFTMPLVTLFVVPSYFIPLMVIAILVALRHKENIHRLRDGVENKVSFRS